MKRDCCSCDGANELMGTGRTSTRSRVHVKGIFYARDNHGYSQPSRDLCHQLTESSDMHVVFKKGETNVLVFTSYLTEGRLLRSISAEKTAELLGFGQNRLN